MINEKQQKKQPRVIVFSTPTCSYCNMAKNTGSCSEQVLIM